MKPRPIVDGVSWVGAVDWDRRLFDALIPLPDGTSYNSYLVRGAEKTVLIDAVDPKMLHLLRENLAGIESIDYLVAHHAEQDHSGGIPWVLAKYPKAQLLCSPKAKSMLVDHLAVDEGRIRVMADGETLPLGGKTLRFIHTPWVHWPETMSSYLEEPRILFSCDWFGSHLATSDLFVRDCERIYEPAKRYFAEIMMPFRTIVRANLDKIKDLPIDVIAPSHGPLYDRPGFIVDAYRDWTADAPHNLAVIPWVSMHDSTALLVDRLTSALVERGVGVLPFDLPATDVGKLAMSLVDAATVVFAGPTVHVGPHPALAYAALLTNALRPKLRFAAVVGSYGWAGKLEETVKALAGNLKVEWMSPVIPRGLPRARDFEAVEALAASIADRHRSLGLG